MAHYLEIQGPAGTRLVALDGARLSVGAQSSNDVPLDADDHVSRLHAVFESYGGGWAVRDLGSRNGTYVNGERVWAERLLRPGDEVRVGRTRVVYRESGADSARETRAAEAPPSMTRRERDVLVALCRPLLSGVAFTEPATIKEVAAMLVLSETAVKKHVTRLYDKFGIHDGDRRRTRLANEAIQRGAVTLTDLNT